MRIQSLAILFCVLAGSATLSAQPSIAGSAKDSSGAPLAGVLVEFSSAALIEKTRTTTTDSTGRYRIDELRPGTYEVRFTLTGWRTYRHEGVALTGSMTANVSAELVLGRLETVTVSGRPPVVDVHNATSVMTLSGEVVKSIPTVRTYNALLGLVPGIVTSVNDVVTETATTSFPVHGGRSTEGRVMVDGFTVGSPPSGNSATSYTVNGGHAQEVTFTVGGALGENETGGLVMNLVPRSGGNTTRGSIFVSGSGKALQSDNVTPALHEQGVVAATPLAKVYETGYWAFPKPTPD